MEVKPPHRAASSVIPAASARSATTRRKSRPRDRPGPPLLPGRNRPVPASRPVFAVLLDAFLSMRLLRLGAADRRQLGERPAVTVQRRHLARGLLPARDRDVDERRADLDRAAPAARALGGDELRATAAERLEHDVARLR